MPATEMILGIAFIDIEIEIIEMNNRNIVPRNVHASEIGKRLKDEDGIQSLSEGKAPDDEKRRTKRPICTAVKIVRKQTRSEKLLIVLATEERSIMVQKFAQKPDQSHSPVAGDIVELSLHHQFCIMVVNTSKVPVTLPKNMNWRQLMDATVEIISLRDNNLVESVNAVSRKEKTKQRTTICSASANGGQKQRDTRERLAFLQ